jgi:hypothetical protein
MASSSVDVEAAQAQLAALGIRADAVPRAPLSVLNTAGPVSAPSVNIAALVSRGRAARANGDWATALRCFEAAHRALPEDAALAAKVVKLRVTSHMPTHTRAHAVSAQGPLHIQARVAACGGPLAPPAAPAPAPSLAPVPAPVLTPPTAVDVTRAPAPPKPLPLPRAAAAPTVERSNSSASALAHAVTASSDRLAALPTVDKLFPHQREGIAWMLGLHDNNQGGILGDDMGSDTHTHTHTHTHTFPSLRAHGDSSCAVCRLGKTIQVISVLRVLFLERRIRSALIIMPTSLIDNWLSEFSTWCVAPSRPSPTHGVLCVPWA